VMLPERAAGSERYAHAAALLAQWRGTGVLVRDAEPAVYVMAQEFALASGERRTRIGMFAAVAAEPYETRRIRPHERTHTGPKADRLALLRATATNVESIFLLAPDPDRTLATALAEVTKRPPGARAQLDGVGIRLWVVMGEAASRLPQLITQITGYLDRALAAGRLGHDLGEDPATAVEATAIFLGDARTSAAALASDLDAAQQQLAPVNGTPRTRKEQS